MIRETAEIRIREGSEAGFLAAVETAVPLFRAAPGCRAMTLERVVETPGLFRLQVLWDRIEDHMEGFRNSPAFGEWRALVGPFFAEPPRVDHGAVAVAGFGAGPAAP